MFAAGAALAWNSKALDEKIFSPVLSRDVFEDPTGNVAEAGFKLGFAHQKLGVKALNETPLGTVIAAPRPEDRELFCRNGLKWFAKIPAKKILAALKEIEAQRQILSRANQNRIQERFLRANWIWRRGWRSSRASSCSGSRRSPRENSPRQKAGATGRPRVAKTGKRF